MNINIVKILKTPYTLVRTAIRKHRRKAWVKALPVIKDRTKSHASYSGKYVLTIEQLHTGKGTWEYTRGTVKTKSGSMIAVVDRNYSRFPFAFVEGHRDGHDYLICGDDYQGQTIVQLTTGERADKFIGFCWSDIHPSPDGQIIAVEGCGWGGPYELVFYDFRDPMKLPLPVISVESRYETFERWIDPTEAKISRRFDYSVKYNLPEHMLTREQLDEILKETENAETDEEYEKSWREIVEETTWKKPNPPT